MNTTSGEVAAVVAVLGVILSGLGVTGVDPSLLNSAVQGVVAIVTLVAAIWSWWQHRKANTQ